jgi:hypothetical protein
MDGRAREKGGMARVYYRIKVLFLQEGNLLVFVPGTVGENREKKTSRILPCAAPQF